MNEKLCRNVTLPLGRSQLTPPAGLWGMSKAWREVAIKRGMGDKSTKGLLAIFQLVTKLYQPPLKRPPCLGSQNCHFSSDPPCNRRELPLLRSVRPDSWTCPLFWSWLAAASNLAFYWGMIRCRASCKDVRILSHFLQGGDLVQISGSYLVRDFFISAPDFCIAALSPVAQ